MTEYTRNAAHKKYEKAKEITDANQNVSLEDALGELSQDANWIPESANILSPAQLAAMNQAFGQIGYDYTQDPLYQETIGVSKMIQDNPTERKSPQDYVDELNEQSILNPHVTQFEQAANDYKNENAMQLLQEDIDKQNEFEKDIGSHLDWINGGYGELSQFDPMYQQKMQEIFSENYEPSSKDQAREMYNRLTDHGDIKTNPIDWNILGFTSQQPISNGGRAAYESYYDQHKASGKLTDRGVVNPDLIDDGNNPMSREAIYITGEEYARQREFGLPGRDIDDIIARPDVFYNKQEEQDKYGYIPYLTSDKGISTFHDKAAENTVANIFSDFANARRINTDWDVEYDGDTYSGKEMTNAIGNFNRKTNEQQKNDKWITDPAEVNEYSIPYVPVYHVTDTNGHTEDFRGKPLYAGWEMDDNGNPFILYYWGKDENGNDRFAMFDDQEDLNRSMNVEQNGHMDYQIAEDGEEASIWRNIDPFELPNGKKIRADKAQEFIADYFENPDNYNKYDALGFNRPNVETPMQGFVPWITDMLLGSAPLFYRPTAAAQAIGNSFVSNSGMKPGHDYLNGTYSMLSDKPTGEQRAWATGGSALLPITERLYGNIGGRMLEKPLAKLIGKPIESVKPGARYLMGTAGEALEEVPGNIVEELMQGYGPSEWYADPKKDENGNIIQADDQGHAARDTTTSAVQRIHNFLNDAPLAMLGGGILGGTLGVGAVPGYQRQYNKHKNDTYQKPYSEGVVVPLSEEELEFYNR